MEAKGCGGGLFIPLESTGLCRAYSPGLISIPRFLGRYPRLVWFALLVLGRVKGRVRECVDRFGAGVGLVTFWKVRPAPGIQEGRIWRMLAVSQFVRQLASYFAVASL
jgi:hypothetical protein